MLFGERERERVWESIERVFPTQTPNANIAALFRLVAQGYTVSPVRTCVSRKSKVFVALNNLNNFIPDLKKSPFSPASHVKGP